MINSRTLTKTFGVVVLLLLSLCLIAGPSSAAVGDGNVIITIGEASITASEILAGKSVDIPVYLYYSNGGVDNEIFYSMNVAGNTSLVNGYASVKAAKASRQPLYDSDAERNPLYLNLGNFAQGSVTVDAADDGWDLFRSKFVGADANPTAKYPGINFFNYTVTPTAAAAELDSIPINVSYYGVKFASPWTTTGSASDIVPISDDNVTIRNGTVKINHLELFSYNGWTQTEKRETGKSYAASTNVTDVNTGTEVWTAKDNVLGHFNAVNKSQIVYNLSGSLTEDCQFTDTPQFYSYSGKNISMTYEGSGSGSSIHKDGQVTVKYYSSTQNPLTDTPLGEQKVSWDETNKRVNLSEASSLVPAQAAYCLIFFEGRPLGDVSGDLTVEAADITTMSSCFAGGFAKTDIDTFYGDVTSDGNYEAADLTCLSSYRAGGASEDYA